MVYFTNGIPFLTYPNDENLKGMTTKSVGKHVLIHWWQQLGTTCMEGDLPRSNKTTYILAFDPEILLLGIYPEDSPKNRKTHLHKFIHLSITVNYKTLKTA